MSKQEILDIIKLLSALESWTFGAGKPLPGGLLEDISACVDALTKDLLEGSKP